MISLEYEMELGQSHDQPDENQDDEPPTKKMRYGDAELDEGRDPQTTGRREDMVSSLIPDDRHFQRSSEVI